MKCESGISIYCKKVFRKEDAALFQGKNVCQKCYEMLKYNQKAVNAATNNKNKQKKDGKKCKFRGCKNIICSVNISGYCKDHCHLINRRGFIQ